MPTPNVPSAATLEAEAVVLKRLPMETAGLDDVVVKVADTIEEHEAAARLTFEAYAERGLLAARGVGVRVSPYLLMPGTVRFVALRRGEVIATLSYLLDSELGLPMESIFGDAIAARRAEGRRMAEVSALAIKKEHRAAGLAMLVYKAAIRAAVELLGLQDLVVAVHPDAAAQYTVPLRFTALSERVEQYPGLGGAAPAVGLVLDLETFRERVEARFAQPTPGQFDTRVYFFETAHPQLHLPTDAAALAEVRAAQRFAAMRLAALRPDVLVAMDEAQFQRLQRSLLAAA